MGFEENNTNELEEDKNYLKSLVLVCHLRIEA
jgi:hypothetical protein